MLLVSTHNICFLGEIKKYQCFWIEKKYLIKIYTSGVFKLMKCIRIGIKKILFVDVYLTSVLLSEILFYGFADV